MANNFLTAQLAHSMNEARKSSQWGVTYNPLSASDYWQKLATEGYGQQGLRDMLLPQVQNIQNQYMNQRNAFLGESGKRGLYDSSIKEKGLAGLVGQREGAIGSAQADIWKQNQKVMLEGQKVLEELRRFNTQNQFQAETFGKEQGLQWTMHQDEMEYQRRMLEEQKRASKASFMGGLLGLGVGMIPYVGDIYKAGKWLGGKL